MNVIIIVTAIFLVWLFGTQIVARIICGTDASDDEVLDMWAAFGVLSVMLPLIGLLYIGYWLLWKMFPLWAKEPTADRVII